MNNKVLKLLQQSVTEYKQNWDIPEDSNPRIPQEIIDRFAKLIVQECINIAHTNADVDETYDYACHTIACKIEEHFGVE